MPEKESAQVTPLRKRRRWRRVLKVALWMFVGLVVLHRPLVFWGGPAVARYFAGREGLAVTMKVSGSIFTNLELSNVEVIPNGTKPTPVEFVRIERMRLEYSLWRLVRHGTGEALTNYELRGADLSIVPMPEREKRSERAKRKTVARILSDILAQPAAYSDRAEIVDLNIRVQSQRDRVDVRAVNILFDPVEPGWLRVGRLELPGVPFWEGIDATASYAQRHLILENLRLSPDLAVRRLDFDASKRRSGRARVSVLAEVFGGTLEAAMEERPGEPGEAISGVQVSATVENVKLREALTYFGVKGVPVDEVASMKLNFAGDPETPRTWMGALDAVVAGLGGAVVKAPLVKVSSKFADAKAVFAMESVDGSNRVALTGELGLPEDVDGWRTVAGYAELKAAVPEASKWSVLNRIRERVKGGAEGAFRIGWKGSVLSAEGAMSLREFAAEGVEAGRGEIEVSMSIPIQSGPRIALGDLSGGIRITADEIARGLLRVDAIKAEVEVGEGHARLRTLDIRRESNRVTGSGLLRLVGDLRRPEGELMLEVTAPRIESFGIALGRDVAAGSVEGRIHMRFAEGRPEGEATISAVLRAGGWSSGDVKLKVVGEEGNLVVEALTAEFGEGDLLTAAGRFSPIGTQDYDGSVTWRISDLANVAELLRVFGVEKEITGAVEGDWSGSGKLSEMVHRGEARLAVRELHVDGGGVDEADMHVQYDGDEAEGGLRVLAGPTQLRAALSRTDGWVRLREIELEQGGQRALSGEVGYRVGPGEDGQRNFRERAVSVNLAAERLDIGKLLGSFGMEKPVAGTVTASLRAEGPLLRPEMELTVEARGLKAVAMSEIEPAEVDLKAVYGPGRLEVDARIRQALIEPAVVRAELPLDLEKLATDGKIDPDLPLVARIRLPETSLAPLPKLLPVLRRLNGTAALDIEAAGTLGRPRLRGIAVVKLADARLRESMMPPIGKFDARLVFEDEALRFEQFRGEVGGGTFGVSGRIRLANFLRPEFDVRIETDDVLVMRDDSMTVRLDGDLRVTGPLDGGRVAGTVFVTQSRFFKEIDILPIGLPGRPKPVPRQAPVDRTISLPPPFQGWTFDVAIRTRPDDPFAIRGNLANGRVALNLQLGGTGAEPWLEGMAIIERFTGSLPFSTLTVENGRVLFSRQAPFQAVLEIQAESRVRDYSVVASIYGRAEDPKLVLTSEPPLPHADLVSLLATGTTTSELSGSVDVLASRAAILAVQSLWRKMFRRGAPPEVDSKTAAQDFLDRFEMEFGAVDEKTGAREAMTRFRINDQTYIVGELDTEGRYTGSVKYLLRFR